MEILKAIWIIVQVAIGYNLLFPAFLFLLWPLLRNKKKNDVAAAPQLDYAFIVTAYLYTETLPSVVNSILKLNYNRYVIYVVADNCNIDDLHFSDPRIVLMRPPEVLGSNTKSHQYAVDHFIRKHDVLTIIDSDNLVDDNYISELNKSFAEGFDAVQGLRAAKNLDGTIACLDAARDIYYHFYDGKLLFECGSSATLSGSGMAFKTELYSDFLAKHKVSGAGFDKVLQAWLLMSKKRIAFNEAAVVFDEKTSRSDQLVNQRSRWINTWFKYFKLGFTIVGQGVTNFNRNQFLFGLVLLRPPLFIFLLLAVLFMGVNLLVGWYLMALIWFGSLILFVIFFLVSLGVSKADKRIYTSLVNIPKFIFYQLVSLSKVRKANKISVATKHYHPTDQRKDD